MMILMVVSFRLCHLGYDIAGFDVKFNPCLLGRLKFHVDTVIPMSNRSIFINTK